MPHQSHCFSTFTLFTSLPDGRPLNRSPGHDNVRLQNLNENVIPLLVEKKLQARVDRILLVDCRKSVQIERLMERDNCSRKQARNILKNQATRRQRLAAADDVISNENDIASVEQQVLILHKKYRVYRKNS